jgi:sulfoxide reductase heme-binding subunit YedZ
VEPGAGAAHRRVPAPQDAALQRVRGRGRVAVRGDGSEEELLTTSTKKRWLLQAATIVVGLLPIAKVLWDGVGGRLGANPIELVQDRLGFWTLTFLTLSLAATPAHELLGLTWPVRIRRTVGLLAFGYASLHLVWYVAIDQIGDVGLLVKDVTKRRFMAVGFIAWLLLVPLAWTSTSRWVRRLGYVRWKRLHRLVYVAALLGVVHFIWRVKADLRQPLWFAAIVGALLALRLVPRPSRRPAAVRVSAPR